MVKPEISFPFYYLKVASTSENKEEVQNAFASIHKLYLANDYNIDSSLFTVKNDCLSYSMFFYRLVSILFTQVDTDKLPVVLDKIVLLNDKIFTKYEFIPQNIKFNFFEADSFAEFGLSLVLSFASIAFKSEPKIVKLSGSAFVFTNESINKGGEVLEAAEIIGKLFKSLVCNAKTDNWTPIFKFSLPLLLFSTFEYSFWEKIRSDEVEEYLILLDGKLKETLSPPSYSKESIYPVEQSLIDVEWFSSYFQLANKEHLLRLPDQTATDAANAALFSFLLGQLTSKLSASLEREQIFNRKVKIEEKEVEVFV